MSARRLRTRVCDAEQYVKHADEPEPAQEQPGRPGAVVNLAADLLRVDTDVDLDVHVVGGHARTVRGWTLSTHRCDPLTRPQTLMRRRAGERVRQSRAVRDSELSVDVGQVHFDRLRGHVEHVRDVAVALSLRGELGDAQLARGQRLGPAERVAPGAAAGSVELGPRVL